MCNVSFQLRVLNFEQGGYVLFQNLLNLIWVSVVIIWCNARRVLFEQGYLESLQFFKNFYAMCNLLIIIPCVSQA